MSDISDRLLNDLVEAMREIVRKEQSERLRDIYLIGDIDKDSARGVIERLRELANDSRKPITHLHEHRRRQRHRRARDS